MKRSPHVAMLVAGIVGVWGGLGWALTVTLTPSLRVTEEFDDNILLSPTNRESDFITAITPGLDLTIREDPWTVTAAASVEGLYYVTRSDLNTFTDNRQGRVAIDFQPTRRFSASLAGTYIRTISNPSEADPATGVIIGRFPTTRSTISPVMSYQVDGVTLMRLQYAFSMFRAEATPPIESATHDAELFVQRDWTPRTSGTLRYTFSHFDFEDSPDLDAHFPALGIIHNLSPSIRLSGEAGPILLERPDGSTEITVGGILRYGQEFRQGNFSLTYDRNARVAGGIGEVTIAQRLTGTFAFSATRALTLGLNAQISDTQSRETAAKFLGYSATVSFTYQLLRWLAFNAGYRHEVQDDRTGPLDVERNVVFVGFTASTDVSVY